MTIAPIPLEISPEELAQRRAEAAVLDVREPWELEICQIAGSLAIPLGTLPARVDELPRDRMLVVLCHHGGRSARAVAWLRAQGYGNATNLSGGIDAWARQVAPEMRTY